MLAKGKDGEWHDYNELSRDEQEQWDRGQREADEEWERRKNGVPTPSLEQKLIERESAKLLLHC